MLLAWGWGATPALAQPMGNSLTWQPQALLLQALAWIEGLGLVGGIAFVGLYILATVAFVPGAALTLGAGVIFGVVLGSIYVFVGATIGATLAFLVGRYLARDWVSRRLARGPKFAAIDAAVAQAGFKIVLLTRLSPVFPFNALNYAFGVTGVSLRDYTLGSIGMLPGTVLYVYLGSLAGDLARLGTADQPPPSMVQWSAWIFGLLATIAVTIYATQLAQRALATVVDQDERQKS